jgi:hypothetical protein
VSYEASTNEAGKAIHFLDMLFKLGLSDWADVELGYSPVTMRQRADRAGWLGAANNVYGRSLYLRAKLRLLGTRESPWALSIAPLLSVPFTGDSGLEAGATLLFGAELARWLAWELNGSVFYEAQEGVDKRAAHAVPCTALTARLFGPLKVFSELYLERPLGIESNWTGTVDTGLLYLLTNDVQFDTGVYLGLSGALPAYTAFVGLSFRL